MIKMSVSFNIVTNLINTLPGNSSVNTFHRATMKAVSQWRMLYSLILGFWTLSIIRKSITSYRIPDDGQSPDLTIVCNTH
jgi:hypothetical protein